MTGSTGSTGEQPQVTATVSPAPPPRSRWGAIPRRLGRARTSTVVLSLLFLAVGALWLNIRPDPASPVPATGGTTVEEPAAPTTAVPTTPTPPSEPVPTTPAEPTTTPEVPPTTTSEAPTSLPATTSTPAG